MQQNPEDLQVPALSFSHPLLRLLVFIGSYIEGQKAIHIVHEEGKNPEKFMFML